MKRLDIIKLYKDFHVPFMTKGNKHCSPGWVQVICPFCEGSKDFHLGFNISKEFYHCYRCGSHKLGPTIAALVGQSVSLTKEIIGRYRTGRHFSEEISKEIPHASKVILPGASLDLEIAKKQSVGGQISSFDPVLTQHARAIEYLQKRGFIGHDLTDLIKTYNLHYTGITGAYNFRIIAPIYFDGDLVSYQGRDYTGLSLKRYMACPKLEEVKDHKSCLYAMDLVKTNTVVIVEGIVDQWKLGPGAVATFGQTFTLAQVKLLVSRWQRRIVLYDKGAVQAVKLANILSGFSGKTELVSLNSEKDPGGLTVEKGKEIMRKLGV